MAGVAAVGVGPGSPEYVTAAAADEIRNCDIIAGYGYTLRTIGHLTAGKEIHEVTMGSQEETYQRIASDLGGRRLVVPFTGDVSFSESEVVDRLAEIFGRVRIIPGISSVQVAAARAGVPLDKSRVITMHVTSPIEEKKLELQRSLIDGLSVILIPRPWPADRERHFMPSEIAHYLRENGFDTSELRVHVFENLTTEEESAYSGTARDLEGREFSDLVVMVFDQNRPDSYMNYRWQWQDGAPHAAG